LVLMDSHMPGMDGFSVIESIRSNPKLAGVTIMMLTSAQRVRDVERCRQLGVSHYLVKPIQQSELMQAALLALGDTECRRGHSAAAEQSAPEPTHKYRV